MIPKILNFIWVGDEAKRPDKLIDTWRRKNPGYEIRVWGNAEYQSRAWINRVAMEKLWNRGELCGVADLMRYEILFKQGGITLDADTLAIAPLEDFLLKPEAFATWQNEIYNPGLLQCSHLGAQAGDKFFGSLILDIAEGGIDFKIRDGENIRDPMAWECVGPVRLTKAYREGEFTHVTVWPSHFFTPNHFCGKRYTGTGQVFATQLWHSTKAHHEKIGAEIGAAA